MRTFQKRLLTFFVHVRIRDIISSIRIKLKASLGRVVKYALTLIEAVVKNCPQRVLRHVATGFLKSLFLL